jgi:hypothetical protein
MANSQVVRIDEMYAFVTVDPADHTEGIIGFNTPTGWMPMVGADTARVEYLVPLAQEMATSLGTPIHVLRFTVREEVMEITP